MFVIEAVILLLPILHVVLGAYHYIAWCCCPVWGNWYLATAGGGLLLWSIICSCNNFCMLVYGIAGPKQTTRTKFFSNGRRWGILHWGVLRML